MIPCAPFTTRWGRTKPPAGVQLDRGHPLARGLVRLWVMNEGAGSPRDLAANVVATPNSSPGWASDSRGHAVSLSGGAYYADAADAGLNNWTVQTLAAWFKGGSQAAFTRVVEKGSNNEWWLAYSGDGTTLQASNANNGPVSSARSTTDGNWHHAVANYYHNGAAYAANLYVDGAFQGTGVSANTPTKTNPLNIGRFGGGGFAYSGRIGLVAVYSRANVLSAAEAAWLYAEPFAMLQPLVRRTFSYAAAAGGTAKVPWHLFMRRAC